MKKSKLDNSASHTRFGLVQFLLALLLFYFLWMSFEIPFIFRTGSGSDDGLPTQMVVGTMEANRAIVGEEQEETPHRPFKDRSRVNRAGHIHREFKTVSEIFTNESFFYGGGFADELSTFHETVKHAISTGRKMWGNLDSGLIPKPNPVKTRTEKCPDTVSVTGSEFVNRSRILVLPCGLTLGSHVTVVATPHWAHAEKGDDGKTTMVTQFMMELQGLKAVEGEDPPRILHFNPRVRGDWSGRPVIEQNTCYRMQWGSALRCDGHESSDDEELVDGEVKCEGWKRDDGDDETKKTWWLNRFMGRRKKMTHDWPYPFGEGKLFVLTLRAGMEGYHISVDGRHITSFPYRTGFVLEDATGLAVKGNIDVHSIYASSLPSTNPSFAPQKHLEMQSMWKAPALPEKPVELFIGILSAGNHFAERMAVRKSWMQQKLVRSSKVVALGSAISTLATTIFRTGAEQNPQSSMDLTTTTRQRRPLLSGSSSSSAKPYSKTDKPRRSDGGDAEDRGLGWFLPFIALCYLRYMSATSNIVHDCDEVFNYWEPLHYLLYKSGFQTWEYSSNFALRSYLYILFHELAGRPASWWFGDDKVRVFYAVRLFLGLVSAVSDTILVVALSRKYGKRIATYAVAMLCLTSGCFFASTSFLPSSFSMYAMSLSSGLLLFEKYAMAVAVSVFGVILGWPFSILAFLPIVVYALVKRFKQAFISGAATSILLLGLSVLVDHYYYKRWTSSVLNLLIYNVLGGGESHLYGTEGPLFYIKNGFNNFNLGFVLAILFIVLFPVIRRKYDRCLLVVISPMYIWLAFMSLQPHKEERFLYPIYPLICVSASVVIENIPELFREKYSTRESLLVTITKYIRPVILGLILCASHARTFSLINGYSAPLEVYKLLEHHDDAGPGSVLCVGSEWHRYPSSFFVPDYISEVRWIDDGFRGLLPFPFNSTLGGTAASPSYFNNKNQASDEQFLKNIETCTFLIELQLSRPYAYRGSDLSTWEAIAVLPYLDRELSPAKYRSFFIPYKWQEKNVFGKYIMLRRVPK